jgi:hypothetical protein
VYELFNAEVAQQLKEDPELALVFYARFDPYDTDTDPLHNPDWIKNTASEREAETLRKAQTSLERAKTWLKKVKP